MTGDCEQLPLLAKFCQAMVNVITPYVCGHYSSWPAKWDKYMETVKNLALRDPFCEPVTRVNRMCCVSFLKL